MTRACRAQGRSRGHGGRRTETGVVTVRRLQLTAEAYPYDGTNHREIVEWLGYPAAEEIGLGELVVRTPQGDMVPDRGDVVIRDSFGDVYPISAERFATNYEPDQR